MRGPSSIVEGIFKVSEYYKWVLYNQDLKSYADFLKILYMHLAYISGI